MRRKAERDRERERGGIKDRDKLFRRERKMGRIWEKEGKEKQEERQGRGRRNFDLLLLVSFFYILSFLCVLLINIYISYFIHSNHCKGCWIQVVLMAIAWAFAIISVDLYSIIPQILFAMFAILQVRSEPCFIKLVVKITNAKCL